MKEFVAILFCVVRMTTAVSGELGKDAVVEKCLVITADCGNIYDNRWDQNDIHVTASPGKAVIASYDVKQSCDVYGTFQQRFCPQDPTVAGCYSIFAKFSHLNPKLSEYWKVMWSAQIEGGSVQDALHRTKLDFYLDPFAKSFVHSNTRYD